MNNLDRTVTVYTDKDIHVNFRPSGYFVTQQKEGTRVYRRKRCDNGCNEMSQETLLPLPHNRYSLAFDDPKPLYGPRTSAGRSRFNADFLAALDIMGGA